MLSENQISSFKENGYLIVKPNLIFDQKDILKLKNLSQKNFFKYQEGESNFIKKKFNADQQIININKIQYIKNGKTCKDNLMTARRATLMGYNMKCGLSNFIENENLIKCAKKLLDTNELSLHTSALIKVYPKCEGEPNKLHTDIPGFVLDPLSLVKKNKFVLNVLVYLSDVTKDLAPMRVGTKTHNNYLNINDYLCQEKNVSNKSNLLHASDIGVDEKIIRELNFEIKSLEEKMGTVIFMSGNLLHAATANNTNSSRLHFNCNFSRREDKEIRKFNYSRMLDNDVDIKKFYNNFKDKKILERSYINSNKNFLLERYYRIKNKLQKIIN